MHLIKKYNQIWILTTPQRLGGFVGIIFLIVGVFGTVYMATPHTLSCAKKQPDLTRQCELTHPLFNILGMKETFAEVKQAKLINRTQKDAEKSYSIRLYTSSGKYFISKSFNTDRAKVKNIADKINHYLADEKQLFVTIPGWEPFGSRLVLGFFIPFSLVFLYVCAARTFTIDLKAGKISLSKKLLGLLTIGHSKSYHFKDIETFVVESKYSAKFGQTYQLIAKLKNGNELAINTLTDGERKTKDNLAKELNQLIIKTR